MTIRPAGSLSESWSIRWSSRWRASRSSTGRAACRFPTCAASFHATRQCALRGLDRDGRAQDCVVEGFEARIVQHEFDHLNGVLFLDRMRDLHSLAYLDEWREFLNDPADTGRLSSAVRIE